MMFSKEALIHQISILRDIVYELDGHEDPPLNSDQKSDISSILSAIDVLEQRAGDITYEPMVEDERLQVFHDLTSPINGIIGYLYILSEEFSAPLSRNQRRLVQTIDTHINRIHEFISSGLLTPRI